MPAPKKPFAGTPGPGRPKGSTGKHHAPGQKQLKNLTKAELVEAMNLIVRGRASDLMDVAKNPNATSLEKMVGSIVSSIIIKGDMQAFDKLLDRMIGKVTDTMHVTGDSSLVRVQVNMPSNGREAKKP